MNEALDEWGLTDRPRSIPHTGCNNGARMLIEKKMKKKRKNLLHFAYRHHVIEIAVEAVLRALMGLTIGPEVLLFKRFQAKWESLGRST